MENVWEKYTKQKEICPAYISNIDSNWGEKILLIIQNEEKEGREAKSEERWHYLEIKKLSTLFRGITSEYHGGFFAWIVFILLEQKIRLGLMKKFVKIKISVKL